jgi:hypothetical protein
VSDENLISFLMTDERTGFVARFIAEESHPGKIQIEVKEGEEFRPATPEDLQTINDHDLSSMITQDLIVEAGKSWKSWRPIRDQLLLTAGQRVAWNPAEA